jgi:hypothetical protein
MEGRIQCDERTQERDGDHKVSIYFSTPSVLKGLSVSNSNDYFRLFHDAIGIATRTLSLMHRFSKTPYSWYTKRFRDAHSSAFLALNLACGQHVDEESMNLGCSVLVQLFPVDNSGTFLEAGLHRSVLGRVLSKGLERRAFHKPSVSDLNEHALQTAGGAGTGIFQPSLATSGNVSLPHTVTSGESFPITGSILGDFDSMMDDPLWPAGAPGPGNVFPAWV